MTPPLKMTLRMLLPVCICLLLVGLALRLGEHAARKQEADREQVQDGWSAGERKILEMSDSVMYVTVLPDDSLALRTPSRNLTDAMLRSDEFRVLAANMLATVRSPRQDGVGIAAPQVGIGRRLVWVQRYDKEGEPWELFPNVQIDSLFGDIVPGPEGCLSVPPMRGVVPRHSSVIVRWTDPQTLQERRDTVHGYTAVIFQHECDHLAGTLYIDRADSVFVSADWAAERSAFPGAYDKPAWW